MEVPQGLSGSMSNEPKASTTSAHGGRRCALSQEKKDRITMLLAGGMKVGEISTLEDVSVRSVHKIRGTLRTWGTHTLEPMAPSGPKKKLNPDMIEAIRAYVQGHPWTYLTELQNFILEKFDIFVSVSRLSRCLRDAGIKRKTFRKKQALQQPDLYGDGVKEDDGIRQRRAVWAVS